MEKRPAKHSSAALQWNRNLDRLWFIILLVDGEVRDSFEEFILPNVEGIYKWAPAKSIVHFSTG